MVFAMCLNSPTATSSQHVVLDISANANQRWFCPVLRIQLAEELRNYAEMLFHVRFEVTFHRHF